MGFTSFKSFLNIYFQVGESQNFPKLLSSKAP